MATHEIRYSKYDWRNMLQYISRSFSWSLVRKVKAYYLLGNSGVKIGKAVRIKGRAGLLSVGENVNIYDNCVFHLHKRGALRIGSHVILSYNIVLECGQEVTIGDHVQIGEFTSIRDTTHDYKVHGNMMGSPDVTGSIRIGNNVWIGRGCLICENTIIEDGVVVAANSVVKGHLYRDTIYGGAPATIIKSRLDT